MIDEKWKLIWEWEMNTLYIWISDESVTVRWYMKYDKRNEKRGQHKEYQDNMRMRDEYILHLEFRWVGNSQMIHKIL